MMPLSKGEDFNRCSTPFGITEVGILGAAIAQAVQMACSTPFGITEVGMATSPQAARGFLRVLNAFRHHRGGHSSTRRCHASGDVLNAFRHHRGGHDVNIDGFMGEEAVLNAFRHHRGGHFHRGT